MLISCDPAEDETVKDIPRAAYNLGFRKDLVREFLIGRVCIIE